MLFDSPFQYFLEGQNNLLENYLEIHRKPATKTACECMSRAVCEAKNNISVSEVERQIERQVERKVN